jgi:GntR family transcriptional regulator, N-acetylglucosamine utilization regulator
MVTTSLNKYSHVPLYQQLVDKLIVQIRSGELRPGDRVPSEREIAESHKVSRTTARLALEELVATGLIYREQGRGTFVAASSMRSLIGFASFTEDFITRGCKPGSRILAHDLIDGDEVIRKALRLDEREMVLRLVRLRLADNKPVAIQTSYLPAKLVPGLENRDMTNQSLFAILRQDYYVYPAWTEAEIETARAEPTQAELLGISPGDPVLIVRGLSYTDSFETVESVETVYRGEGLCLYIGRQRLHTLGTR